MSNDKLSNDILGMQQSMVRKDIVSSDLASGAPNSQMNTFPGGLSPEDWDGYSGVGDYQGANGNTHATMLAGHGIRDGRYGAFISSHEPADETYDCVIVGGGISGLAAANTFAQRTGQGKTCLVLENHSIFGGEARRNEVEINGKRLISNQGSAMFFPPLPGSSLLSFYESIGFDGKGLDYQRLDAEIKDIPVGNTIYAGAGKNLGMFFGARFGHPEGLWLTDPWGKNLDGAPFPPDIKQELLNARKPQNTNLVPKEYGDAASRQLDRMTQEDFIIAHSGLRRETIRTYMPNAGSYAGASADAISGLADFAPDLLFPWDKKQGSQMFPGGNTGIARFQVKSLIPDAIPGANTIPDVCLAKINFSALDRPHQHTRIRLGATVIAVKHDGDPKTATDVTVTYLHEGKPRRVKARSVVMAGGWPTWRTMLDLPETHREAYQQFFRMPCMVVNIALTNWQFLAKRGISDCVWYEGLSDSFAIRRLSTFAPTGEVLGPNSPVMLTLKVLFTEPGLSLQQQATRGRMKMLSTPFSEYERTLREQFNTMFSPWGFDAKRDIAGIILNRWGHAYLCAQPGFFFGENGKPAPREILRRAPFGRIAFANSDLSGIMDHRASIEEAQRSIMQLLA